MRGALLVAVAVCGCGSKKHEPATRPVAMITTSSVVVADACPQAKQLDSKRTTKEIEELVGPCTTIPGGTAHFSAILLPDGRVELASPSGDPSLGVIPTCLVQNQTQLRHKLRLKSACRFDVKLEEHKQ